MSEFHEKVYAVARKIPGGKVVTYGQLALLAGKPRAARLVGTLMKNCPEGNGVPCHRVIKSDGSLCGDGLWGMAQRELLREEGVAFQRDGRVDLGQSRWGGA
ncbi:MAG: methylated-DNA--[protein]-cysteine S-methyltransferase, partial [Firmicutes bacterium]|nr:methylated-DNA--[protein]-cysteine S-methyltransferase [Bacillota bacterium]